MQRSHCSCSDPPWVMVTHFPSFSNWFISFFRRHLFDIASLSWYSSPFSSSWYSSPLSFCKNLIDNRTNQKIIWCPVHLFIGNGNIRNATCKCSVSSFFTDCSVIKNLSKDCQFYMHELIDIGLDKVLCIILNISLIIKWTASLIFWLQFIPTLVCKKLWFTFHFFKIQVFWILVFSYWTVLLT